MNFLRCCPVCFKRGKKCKCGMSTDIEIKTDGCQSLHLEIKANSLEFEAWNHDEPEAQLITMSFDMRDKEDRSAIKNLISHLQHQLQIHEYPPYSTCPSCSWLKRERGIEACEEHIK
jgi:hypothetical protein